MAACSSGGGVTSTSAPVSPSEVPSETGSPAGSPSTATGSDTSAADGIYAVTITERDAADAGVPKNRYSDFVGDYELDLVRGQLAMYFTGVITLDPERNANKPAVVLEVQESGYKYVDTVKP